MHAKTAALLRASRETITLLYFGALWGIFLFFYAGSYNYGADDRFSLMTFPPMAVMAGIGAWTLAQRISRPLVIAAIVLAGVALLVSLGGLVMRRR